jgi:FXSXX-COOH protein
MSRDLVIWSDVMTSQEKDIPTVIPDLRDLPVDRLAELGSSALANSIARYRERLRENGIPLSSFQARI